MNKLTDNELWDIIDDIDWKGACIKSKRRPYNIVGDIIVEKYPELILELKEFTRKERDEIKSFLSSYIIGTGNDLGWYLTAHIIGCGKDYIKEVKEKVISGEYTGGNIYDKIPYQENFEYSFSRAMEKLVGDVSYQTGEDKYKEWLRNRKIDNIINQ